MILQLGSCYTLLSYYVLESYFSIYYCHINRDMHWSITSQRPWLPFIFLEETISNIGTYTYPIADTLSLYIRTRFPSCHHNNIPFNHSTTILVEMPPRKHKNKVKPTKKKDVPKIPWFLTASGQSFCDAPDSIVH